MTPTMSHEDIQARYIEKEKERITAYRDAFKSEAGQKVIKDLKQRFYDVDLLNKHSPHNTHYNLGMRDTVRHILETLEERDDV